eukprot:jgi/Galph1/3732/GphlegSOOS_G2418.1
MTTLWSSAVSVVPSVSAVSSYIYDDDEELRNILLSCKKYRDTMDMVVRAAKAYRKSLGELAVAGKAAGEVYTCVADFTKSKFEEERRRSQNHFVFGSRRDNTSVIFDEENVSSNSFLYPENIRKLLTVLGDAERNAHDGTTLFMERVSNPIITEGRKFHEKYVELHRLKEQYKNCKVRYLEAQRSLNKELTKPKASMEAQVKGWAKVDELRREYNNISSHLLRFATELEQEHQQSLLEHVASFIIHHYGTLSASLDAVRPALKLIREQWLSGDVEFLGDNDILDARHQAGATPPNSVSPSTSNDKAMEQKVSELESEKESLQNDCEMWKETAMNYKSEISAKDSVIEKLKGENEKLWSIIFSTGSSVPSSRKTSDLSFLSSSRERSMQKADRKEIGSKEQEDSHPVRTLSVNAQDRTCGRYRASTAPNSWKESSAALISQYQAYKASRKSIRNVSPKVLQQKPVEKESVAEQSAFASKTQQKTRVVSQDRSFESYRGRESFPTSL